MELSLPNISGKRGTEFYRESETFKRRSEANRKSQLKYWSDKRHRQRVDKKQAKPVDVFDSEGHYLKTYPSARKAAIAIYKDVDYHSAERLIRACRCGRKRQYRGYQFRDATEDHADIPPIPKRRHKPKGYHVNRRPGTYHTKPCTLIFDDGDTLHFDSLIELAEAVHGSYGGVWAALKAGRKYKGYEVRID